MQLIQDYEDYAEVNKQLEKMGYNIGTRLIEDFLARSSLGRCADFREVGEVVAKVRACLLACVLVCRQLAGRSTPSIAHIPIDVLTFPCSIPCRRCGVRLGSGSGFVPDRSGSSHS